MRNILVNLNGRGKWIRSRLYLWQEYSGRGIKVFYQMAQLFEIAAHEGTFCKSRIKQYRNYPQIRKGSFLLDNL